MTPFLRIGLAAAAVGLAGLLAGCEDTTESVQTGYRGTGMVQLTSPEIRAEQARANAIPEPQPAASGEGPKVSELTDVYQNVQILGDLTEEEFLRTMTAITEWVSPEQGCEYCHNLENLAEDSVYTKIVARRMFQMVWGINGQWTDHVAETGVTCYTCHRGHPVPLNVWAEDPGPPEAGGMARTNTGQNLAGVSVGLTSLPYDPFSPLLTDPAAIRVLTPTHLASGSDRTIQDTEATYGLMIHMSESLGVNCTFCHNTQNFGSWTTSTPQRVTAWHGLRMVADINATYIDPLAPILPDSRKGPLGDPLKTNCATCHQGVNKPLLGVSMLQDYLASLGGQRAASN